MSTPEDPDQPRFDITQFEAEAQARGAELVQQVTRLAIFDEPEELQYEWVETHGALYDLPDGTEVTMEYETYEEGYEESKTRIRVTRPSTEIRGSDNQLRRVTLTRFVLYETVRPDIPLLDPEALADLEKELPPAPEGLDEMGAQVQAEIAAARMEEQLDPNFRPSELIRGRTEAVVECKLAKGANFRTERYSENMPAETRTAHLAARRHAGERVDQPDYDIAEHKALMSLLASIDPNIIEPQPLPYDFDETWREPDVSINSWTPRK